MLDRATFLRPIAHRGLHDAKRGIVENTAPAFAAAIAKGYGIECDLRPAAGGLPIVFHDLTLDRLVEGKDPLAALGEPDLRRMRYRAAPSVAISTFAELLALVGGRVPLFVEIKSEWEPPQMDFLRAIAALSTAYSGPVALMSFDPAVMTEMRTLAPQIPRGIVSGAYRGAGWWNRRLSHLRAAALRNLLESSPVAPDFYAYDVAALPTLATEFARRVQGLPMLTWTVRTEKDRATAAKWADAMIFEGFQP